MPWNALAPHHFDPTVPDAAPPAGRSGQTNAWAPACPLNDGSNRLSHRYVPDFCPVRARRSAISSRVLGESAVCTGALTEDRRDALYADLAAVAEQEAPHMSVTMFGVVAHRPG